MRIYSNARELMSEMGRDLWEMGHEVKPKTYQNKVIEGNDEFTTKEEFCKQYCLTSLEDPQFLFIFTKAKDWAEAELKERLSGKALNPGMAWELRRDMWEQFLVEGREDSFMDGIIGTKYFDYTYPERINRQVRVPLPHDSVENSHIEKEFKFIPAIEAIIELLKFDPDTRKAVLPIFTGNDCNYYDGSRRIPCSMYYGFFIREGKLNMTYHQRSSDFVGHFGNDVYLAWRTMEYVASRVGVKPGHLIHTIDSLHCYKKDWHLLKTSVDDLI